jgi:hypothetical protein
MAHLSIRIPDADLAFLKAEAARQGRDVSFILRDLIHRAYDVTTSPLTADAGELVKKVDREGLLRVLILGARKGQLLVEPDGAGFENILLWVDADLVTIPDAKQIPAPLPRPSVSFAAEGFRTNLMTAEAPGSQEPASASLPVPSKCGICGEPFPSKAAKKRHVRDAHSAQIPRSESSKS